jgi:hypothetical protein
VCMQILRVKYLDAMLSGVGSIMFCDERTVVQHSEGAKIHGEP